MHSGTIALVENLLKALSLSQGRGVVNENRRVHALRQGEDWLNRRLDELNK